MLTFRTKGQDQGPGTTALVFIQKEQGGGGEASSNKSSAERAHYQAMIWLLADTPNPNLPSSTSYGWDEESNQLQYVPKVSDLPPAPAAVMELVKCGCGKSRCSSEACSCKITHYHAQNYANVMRT